MYGQGRILAIGTFACLLAASAAAASGRGANASAFSVASTLGGKTVLPHRIHWLAHPKAPASLAIAEVDFLVDGRLSWVEHNPPYTYGDDGNWLVTTWLSAGRHRFTVRAKAVDGSTAQRTTIARVLPAPPPPPELADGPWTHTFTAAEAGALAGEWRLSIDKIGWRVRDPHGGGALIDVAYLPGGKVQLRGGIWTKPHSNVEGNAWCEDTNAPVTYRWSVAANMLTLTLDGTDRCGAPSEAQHLLLTSGWTKAT